jgi:hypothetical protein
VPIPGIYRDLREIIAKNGVLDLSNRGLDGSMLHILMTDLNADPLQKARVTAIHLGNPVVLRGEYDYSPPPARNTLVTVTIANFPNLIEINVINLDLVRLCLKDLPKLELCIIADNPKLRISNKVTQAITEFNVNQARKYWPASAAPAGMTYIPMQRLDYERPDHLSLDNDEEELIKYASPVIVNAHSERRKSSPNSTVSSVTATTPPPTSPTPFLSQAPWMPVSKLNMQEDNAELASVNAGEQGSTNSWFRRCFRP